MFSSPLRRQNCNIKLADLTLTAVYATPTQTEPALSVRLSVVRLFTLTNIKKMSVAPSSPDLMSYWSVIEASHPLLLIAPCGRNKGSPGLTW